MQTSDQNPQGPQVPGTSNFNAAQHHQAEIRNLIEEYFAGSGITGPTSTLHDLLNDFMIYGDEDCPKSRDYINVVVSETTRLMSFLASLFQRWKTIHEFGPQTDHESLPAI